MKTHSIRLGSRISLLRHSQCVKRMILNIHQKAEKSLEEIEMKFRCRNACFMRKICFITFYEIFHNFTNVWQEILKRRSSKIYKSQGLIPLHDFRRSYSHDVFGQFMESPCSAAGMTDEFISYHMQKQHKIDECFQLILENHYHLHILGSTDWNGIQNRSKKK